MLTKFYACPNITPPIYESHTEIKQIRQQVRKYINLTKMQEQYRPTAGVLNREQI